MTTGSGIVLREEYFPLATDISARLTRAGRLAADRRVVIGVGGESGGGKSVTAKALARVLAQQGMPTFVIHQDDYFLRPPRANHEHRVRDISSVGPQEVNLRVLGEHITQFRAGATGITAPFSDYATDSILTQQFDWTGVRVLIVEGTYVLSLPDLDARIFLSATHEETHERRVARARDEITPFVQQVLQIEHDIISQYGAAADLVVGTSFTVEVDRLPS